MIGNKVLKILLFIGMACMINLAYAFNVSDLSFETGLFTGSFSGMQNVFATVNFLQAGNDFGGVLFRKDIQTLGSPETISMNGSTKICTQQIRGIYYDSQRGLRIRPLDTRSLSILTGMDSSYNSLTITGGLYIGCDNDYYNVYGDISYNRSGMAFELIAGTEYNFTGNTELSTYSDNLTFADGRITGYIYDNYGGIGTVDGTGLTTSIPYTIKARPESRVQGAGGWTTPNLRMTGAKVGIYSGHVLLYTGLVSIDRGGTGILAIPGILQGTYDITFEGPYHARSMLSGISLTQNDRNIDFTTGTNLLGMGFDAGGSSIAPYTGYYQFAGDLTNGGGGTVKDQIITTNDYSLMQNHTVDPSNSIYGRYYYDLNADGDSNSTDLGIIVTNRLANIKTIGSGSQYMYNLPWITY